jgi:hypothetical protein
MYYCLCNKSMCVGLVWAIARGSVNMGTNLCTLSTPITCNCSLSQKTIPPCSSYPPCCHECSSGVPCNSGVSVPCGELHYPSGNKTMPEDGPLVTLLRFWKFWVQTQPPAFLQNPPPLWTSAVIATANDAKSASSSVIFRYCIIKPPLEVCNVSYWCATSDVTSSTTLTDGICQ